MFKAVTAFSRKNREKDIVADLVGQSNSKLGIYRPTVGILQASCRRDPEKLHHILKGMSAAFPGVEIIGGTVIGGYTDSSGYTKDGFFLCLIISDTTTLAVAKIRNLARRIETGTFTNDFSDCLRENPLPAVPDACFLYSAYTDVDGNRFIDAVQQVLSSKCLIVGGMATDYWTEQELADFSQVTPPAEKTLLFYAKDGDTIVEDDVAVFLLFYGGISLKYGVSYGWSDIGMRYPGRAEGPTLVEIDGKKTHDFLHELKHPLAAKDHSHMEYSFWFHVPGKEPFMRDIFFDEATGRYHTRGATLPSRCHVSFAFPKKEKVLDEFQRCIGGLGGNHGLVLGVTCCTHQVVLEQDISRECSEMVRQFTNTPILCGYVFGEYGPSFTNREAMLHSCSSIFLCVTDDSKGVEGQQPSVASFFDEIISEQRKEIQSLKKQLRFFEGSKNSKMKQFTEDCLGILLCHSHRSLSNHAERISRIMKSYYQKSGIKAPYATSRNRIVEHLMVLKKKAKKIIEKSA